MREDVEALVDRLKVVCDMPRSIELFAKVFPDAMEVLQLTDEDVAKRFNASKPTIKRWRNGDNAPHAELHLSVYEWLLDEAKKQLTDFYLDELTEETEKLGLYK